ncbi:membrane fusion protein (multidrug efflux system) [Pedobacter sp. UYP30]|uniref:efflux RND transporter periplasmic adaptor subunit n=1 Tax=Pedobacter sp. UYP30 TaxID=1756400 RepID=UPI0033916141
MKLNIIYLGLGALIYVTGCTSKKEEKAEVEIYTVTSPVKMDTSFTKEYVAQIKALRNIEIRAQEKGYLQNIYVNEGQQVKAGQLLFKIMPKEFEAEVSKAKAEAKSAEIDVENTKLLTDKKVVAPNELAMAKSKLDEANAETSLAKLHLSFTEIRAPFAGTIDRIPLKVGSLVDEGALLTNLSDNGQVFAYFNVSEPEYLNYESTIKAKAPQEVNLKLANNTMLKAKGKVETVESEFNGETGNIAFKAIFANPDHLLRNGETGNIEMLVPLKNVLIIPQKSTYAIQDKIFVFVVDNRNIVHARAITIAEELPDLYVVASGLKTTDKILLDGVQNVKDGDKVSYKFQKPEEALKQLSVAAE